VSPTSQSSFVRSTRADVSVWQSCVRQVVANHYSPGDLNSRAVREHRLVQIADGYAFDVLQGRPLPPPSPAAPASEEGVFAKARHFAETLLAKADTFFDSIGQFSDLDPLFAECVLEYLKYYVVGHSAPIYHDPTGQGTSYGTVATDLPSDARVVILGDWGTGLPDASALLAAVLARDQPQALIHLGDVYYAGTPIEYGLNFKAAIKKAEAAAGLEAPLRVYAIPGNHDYFSGGGGFYSTIARINDKAFAQAASYFCLRVAGTPFQFVGVDTGYNDRDPAAAAGTTRTAPSLQPAEILWAEERIEGFDGSTIMLSHHQVFSAHSPLNGSEDPAPYLNRALADLGQRQKSRIAYWFWGHEHSLWIYPPQPEPGLQRGRLVGCSAFQMAPEDNPYQVNYPDVLTNDQHQLPKIGDWYSHGCAVIDFGKREIRYYSFPAWTDTPPATPPTLEDVYTEVLTEAGD
jgi:3',5'-cyclic AMP phosphodiesterase CpdA